MPTPPTTFIASPETYFNSQISLTWSGTIAGTSNIKNYVLQQSTSPDGVSWSGWSALASVVSYTTSGSYSVTPSSVDGMRTRYRIAATDTLDAVSGYTTSNTIQRMIVPETPIVTAPKNNSSTYNQQPRFLIKTGGSADGRTQRVAVQLSPGSSWQDSVNNPNLFSVSGALPNGVPLIFCPSSETLGGKSVTVRCVNDAGSSVSVARSFTILPPPIEDIIPGVTLVKAEHIQGLRIAVDNVRGYYGLSTFTWSEPIVPHRTQIRDWPLHIKEIRTALEAVIALVNAHDTVTMFDVSPPEWIPIVMSSPSVDVVQQIVGIILTL